MHLSCLFSFIYPMLPETFFCSWKEPPSLVSAAPLPIPLFYVRSLTHAKTFDKDLGNLKWYYLSWGQRSLHELGYTWQNFPRSQSKVLGGCGLVSTRGSWYNSNSARWLEQGAQHHGQECKRHVNARLALQLPAEFESCLRMKTFPDNLSVLWVTPRGPLQPLISKHSQGCQVSSVKFRICSKSLSPQDRAESPYHAERCSLTFN